MTNLNFTDMSSDQLLAAAERMTYLRRDLLKVTQQRFAKTLQISQTYYSQLETGYRPLTESLFKQVVSAYHVNPDWLASGTGDIFMPGAELNKEKILLLQQEKALSELRTAYSLKAGELNFLKWYLSLPEEKRSLFTQSLNNLIDSLL